QLRVQVLGDLADPAALEPEHEAVLVVVALPGLGGDVAPRLDHDDVVLGDEPARGAGVGAVELFAERGEQVTADRVLAAETARPGPCGRGPGNATRPAGRRGPRSRS